jgi:regulator of telomere elongation helicase 1
MQGITGQAWYQLEASRAVNQAIGRVIRHKRDFGAILLCDTRFGNSSFKQQLSAWLQPYIQTYSQFGNSYKAVIEFFKKTVTLVWQLFKCSRIFTN